MTALSTLDSSVRVALRTQLWAVSGIPSRQKLENVAVDLKTWAGYEWVREFTKFQNLTPSFVGAAAGTVQRYTQTGSYMVDLFFPKGASTTRADTLVGLVKQAFAPGTSLTASGVRVLILSCSASDSQDDKDGWYFRPVLIAWECSVVQ